MIQMETAPIVTLSCFAFSSLASQSFGSACGEILVSVHDDKGASPGNFEMAVIEKQVGMREQPTNSLVALNRSYPEGQRRQIHHFNNANNADFSESSRGGNLNRIAEEFVFGRIQSGMF